MLYIVITIFILLVIIAVFALSYYFNNDNNSNMDQNIDAGCKFKRYGCCNDNLTTKLDQNGTNCRGF